MFKDPQIWFNLKKLNSRFYLKHNPRLQVRKQTAELLPGFTSTMPLLCATLCSLDPSHHRPWARASWPPSSSLMTPRCLPRARALWPPSSSFWWHLALPLWRLPHLHTVWLPHPHRLITIKALTSRAPPLQHFQSNGAPLPSPLQPGPTSCPSGASLPPSTNGRQHRVILHSRAAAASWAWAPQTSTVITASSDLDRAAKPSEHCSLCQHLHQQPHHEPQPSWAIVNGFDTPHLRPSIQEAKLPSRVFYRTSL
jgi:hypothetical protein